MNVPHLLRLLGWNQTSLTYTDFEEICEQEKIIVQRAPIKSRGMYFLCEGQPFITLSNNLQGVLLWLVAWHELTHHILHPPGLRCFSPGSISKAEFEAQFFALCAVIDEHTLMRILVNGDLHDFPKEMLRQRLSILHRYNL